jgi:hypothetical protein
VTTKINSKQMKRKRQRERKGKEGDAVSGVESTKEEKQNGKVAKAEEEERQQAVVTRRYAGTFAPHIDPPRDKAQDSRWKSQEEEEQVEEKAMMEDEAKEKEQAEVTGRATRRLLLSTMSS